MEGSTRWFLRSLLDLIYGSLPFPIIGTSWFSSLLLAFMWSLFCPLYASTLLVFLFFSNVYYASQGLPLEKPCLLLLHPDRNDPMQVTWGQPSFIHNPRSPDLWIRGRRINKGSGDSVNATFLVPAHTDCLHGALLCPDWVLLSNPPCPVQSIWRRTPPCLRKKFRKNKTLFF